MQKKINIYRSKDQLLVFNWNEAVRFMAGNKGKVSYLAIEEVK